MFNLGASFIAGPFCTSALLSSPATKRTNYMHRTIVLLACFTGLFAQPHSPSPHLKEFGGNTGLVLIASARDGFAVATDGAQVNADGTISRAEKLFPIGKDGAVAIAGSVSIQDPIGKPVREELDLVGMVKGWIDSHPDASLDAGIHEITELASQTSNRFFSAREPGKEAGAFKFALIFVGYSDQKPVITGTRYFAPTAKGKLPKTESIEAPADPGSILVFGPGAVAMELLTGKSAALKKFSSSEAIQNYRHSSPTSLTAEQFSRVLSSIVEATESAQGKALAHGSAVAPPNKVLTITFALK